MGALPPSPLCAVIRLGWINCSNKEFYAAAQIKAEIIGFAVLNRAHNYGK